MEQIYFLMSSTGLTVMDGKAGRLWYQADTLEIYVSGSAPVSKLDTIHYHACEEALARHIPLDRLFCVYRPTNRKGRIAPEQKRLFK